MEQETFAELFSDTEQTTSSGQNIAGTILKGVVVAINDTMVLVDVGLKAEGWVPVSEFRQGGESNTPAIGDEIDVFLERIEDKDGLAILSRERARREEIWEDLERCMREQEQVEGDITGRIRGGYVVDVRGASAFLPGSQVDVRPVRDIAPFMEAPQQFQILKMNRGRGNIIVSRRAILEIDRNKKRDELFANIEEGQILNGIVKNITDYGAFVDLGGVDGLLHVTDLSWKRVSKPADVLEVGQNVKVKVIRYNQETQRVSLGIKQLTPDPWQGIEHKYPVNGKFTGKVSNITDYGVFVILEEGVEGLIHVSEMSWNKKTVNPNKLVSVGEEIEFVVLSIDTEKRRISLGYKQCQSNPWQEFAANHKVSDKLNGVIRNITEFGLFVSIDDNIEGLVHSSDVSWKKPGSDWYREYSKGQKIEVVLLEVNTAKCRVSLGIKQLSEDPFRASLKKIKKGSVVTCLIKQVSESGLLVTVNDTINGFIKRTELSRVRSEQHTGRFAVDEKVDAVVTAIDQQRRELSLSIKAREVSEVKQALETYGSTDSGASLGEILTVALKEKSETLANKKDKAADNNDQPTATKTSANKADKDEAVKDTAAEDETVKDTAAEEETVKDTAAEDETVKDTAAEDEAIKETASEANKDKAKSQPTTSKSDEQPQTAAAPDTKASKDSEAVKKVDDSSQATNADATVDTDTDQPDPAASKQTTNKK